MENSPLMAATGGTREALRAGPQAENTVTTTARTSEPTTLAGLGIGTELPSSMPRAATTRLMPQARTAPRTIPAAPPNNPMTTASSTTESRTWRREAPRAR